MQILHDWDDDKCIEILTNLSQIAHDILQAKLAAQVKVLVIDRLLRTQQTYMWSEGSHYADLLMLSNFASKERYLHDFQTLFRHSGWIYSRVHENRSPFAIVEAVYEVPTTLVHADAGANGKNLRNSVIAGADAVKDVAGKYKGARGLSENVARNEKGNVDTNSATIANVNIASSSQTSFILKSTSQPSSTASDISMPNIEQKEHQHQYRQHNQHAPVDPQIADGNRQIHHQGLIQMHDANEAIVASTGTATADAYTSATMTTTATPTSIGTSITSTSSIADSAKDKAYEEQLLATAQMHAIVQEQKAAALKMKMRMNADTNTNANANANANININTNVNVNVNTNTPGAILSI
jgi:hypothetical protein